MDKNSEGYSDPTAGQAWGNIRRAEKQQAAESVEKDELKRAIKKQIDYQKLEMLTLTQLQKINDILTKAE